MAGTGVDRLLLMHVVTCLVSVGVGILLFWSCIVSLLPSPVLWSIMIIVRVLPLSLSYGLLVLFPRGVGWFMLCVTTLCCLAQLVFRPLIGSVFLPSAITAEDVGACLILLVSWLSVEMLLLCELWAGERLVLEKAFPWYRRPGRPISVSAVLFGHAGSLGLPGNIGRFVLCRIWFNHCRLRHIGCEKCGHGLTSRPRKRDLAF